MNQPKALIPLSLTEMWERFGLYIVQGLLIFYMIKVLGFIDLKAYAVMGQFTALVYIAPVLGGLCADRLLGLRKTILLGAYLLIAGYILLAFPFAAKETAMYLGLSVVIIGNGFLKPNISSFLGRFYHENDTRRDSGFTIYYMVFNLGITFATLSSGYIQENFGWNACFGVAAFGLVLSLIFFRWGYRYFGNEGFSSHLTLVKKLGLVLITILSIAACYILLQLSSLGNVLLALFGGLILVLLAFITFRMEKSDRLRMLALLVLIIISIVFWGLYFQIFLVANVFIDRNVDREIFGHLVPPMVFISLESIFIFMLAPGMAYMWKKLQEKRILMNRGLQFSLSLFVIAFALEFLVIGIHFSSGSSLISPYWVVICYLLITIGELMLSPVGLSMVTQLAPAKSMGLMMGIWFLGLSYGGLLAGFLGKQASVPKELVYNIQQTNQIYSHAFQNYAYLGFAAAILTLCLTPWLSRLIKQK